VIENGKISFTKGYGFAVVSAKREMTDETVINIASISKPITAWGVLRLAETQNVSLNKPVGDYLKRWKLPKSEFDNSEVTLRRLLSHTAGTSVPAVPWFPVGSITPTIIQVLNGEAGGRGMVKVVKKPGSVWSYSGGGYTIAELIIEDAAGKPFEEFMQAQVFKPLGMNRTSFFPSKNAETTAAGYDEENKPVQQYHYVGGAAGGLNTTVRDFAKLLTVYAGEGKSGNQTIISKNLFEQMITPVTKVELEGVENARYGLGHGIHQAKTGETIVYHSGGNPGVRAYFLVSVTKGNGMIVVANSDNGVPVIQELVKLWGENYNVDLQPIY
jgi:CubicO group peptidase (beta-lactamase class C family)